MSFADFATPSPSSSCSSRRHTSSHVPPLSSSSSTVALPSRHAVETATEKLAQFQRQVVAIERSSSVPSGPDEDLNDRIRFACVLQDDLATCLTQIPSEAWNPLVQRKLWRDFDAISSHLKTLIERVAARDATSWALRDDDTTDARVATEPLLPRRERVEFAALERDLAHNDELIAEREHEIASIHDSVAHVQEIFRDLAAIVQDQQETIDGIETHVEKSHEQTQQGLEQVKQAAAMQGSCVVQ